MISKHHTVHDVRIALFRDVNASGLRLLRASRAVRYAEPNAEVHAHAEQRNPPSWGLPRVGQRHLPLHDVYSMATTQLFYWRGCMCVDLFPGRKYKHGHDPICAACARLPLWDTCFHVMRFRFIHVGTICGIARFFLFLPAPGLPYT